MNFFRIVSQVSLCLILISSNTFADELSLSATKDTFLRLGAPNTNEGANKKLSVRKVGKRRALFAFDLSTIATNVPAGQEVLGGKLKLFITDNNKAWGKTGQLIAVHRVSADWTEGNGSNATVPKVDNDQGEEADQKTNRGSGAGATYKCATDTNIKNARPDCSKKWNGGSFVTTPSDTLRILNATKGSIELDVSTDLLAFVNQVTTENFGWLVKKVNLTKTGGVWFASSEASANQPALVVTTGYKFNLSGAEEVPPVTTTKSGSCTASLSGTAADTSRVVHVECTHDLTGVSAAHIHEGAIGVDGSVVCELGDGKSPINADCTLNAEQSTKLINGLYYVNVHTAVNPGGELRGQIQ